MGTIQSFEDIKAWQEARKLVNQVYSVTNEGKFSKDFDLKSQIRRSVISTLSNITEGFERQSTKEFLYFLNVAKGSCGEVKGQLYIAFDQKYIDETRFEELKAQATNTSKLIGGFMKYLKDFEKKKHELN